MNFIEHLKLFLYKFIMISTTVFLWSGGYGEGRTPESIPNSVVKTLSADGTLS